MKDRRLPTRLSFGCITAALQVSIRSPLGLVLGFVLWSAAAATAKQPAADEADPRLVVVLAEDEIYQTWRTVPPFVERFLASDFRVTYVRADPEDRNNLPGIEALDRADLAWFSIRRRFPPAQQMQVIRRYFAAGKPLVAIRTSSHAFAEGNTHFAPEGHATWPDFDQQILGGKYGWHLNNKDPATNPTYVKVLPKARQHTILRGVPTKETQVFSWLYRHRPLAKTATPLLEGRVGDHREPVAWVHTSPQGGRVFYTSLGHPRDFQTVIFQRLVINGTYWAVGRETPSRFFRH